MAKKEEKISVDDRLQAIYDHIPKIQCKGLCHDTCDLVRATNIEYDRLQERTFKQLDQYIFVESIEHKTLMDKGCKCPMLCKERCVAYEARPYSCRMYGVITRLPCEYGCKPESTITPEENKKLLLELFRLNELAGKKK